MKYHKVIIGAGLYGLYSALFCARKGEDILVLEYDDAPFQRATYINQARIHMGYHYPRSYSTAIKSAGYFKRFNEDYSFCIHSSFDQVYATSSDFSWTNAEQFRAFCEAAGIRCDEVSPDKYFKDGMCDGAFLTEEYTYDAQILKQYFMEEIKKYSNCQILFQVRISRIIKDGDYFEVYLDNKTKFIAKYILNATYASSNQILQRTEGVEQNYFKIKYELCEIIICRVNQLLKEIGITVMDGPFFSIMPFGLTGFHSLTSVTFTPHMTSYNTFPNFECQNKSRGFCSKEQLGNCNECPAKPETAWRYMSTLAEKYLKDRYQFEYERSLYSMKPILMTSEIDDSRPTVVRIQSSHPYFISVLSGKINTLYDLDEILNY